MAGCRRCAQAPSGRHVLRERARGVLSRQLILGDTLDTENIKAHYDAGVLTLRIPVAEQAKPRRIEIESKGELHQIET
jgi:HSP20 family protein